ncbi:alpha-N-acetylgalactosamine-specific lectin-like [Antedon mediterranea]|uniref:alpha-N-acetylgalactosamine-specific lectin-like n=1 Tax=Antedon mediterranea TaxID=105859 RepID=UPI003AF9235C
MCELNLNVNILKSNQRAAMGHLVSIQTDDENQFIALLWNSATGGMSVTNFLITIWLGLTDAALEGSWRWSENNQLVTYTNWGNNQPDNGNANHNEHCGHLWNMHNSVTTWNDAPCSYQLFYACELPQNSGQ